MPFQSIFIINLNMPADIYIFRPQAVRILEFPFTGPKAAFPSFQKNHHIPFAPTLFLETNKNISPDQLTLSFAREAIGDIRKESSP